MLRKRVHFRQLSAWIISISARKKGKIKTQCSSAILACIFLLWAKPISWLSRSSVRTKDLESQGQEWFTSRNLELCAWQRSFSLATSFWFRYSQKVYKKQGHPQHIQVRTCEVQNRSFSSADFLCTLYRPGLFCGRYVIWVINVKVMHSSTDLNSLHLWFLRSYLCCALAEQDVNTLHGHCNSLF